MVLETAGVVGVVGVRAGVMEEVVVESRGTFCPVPSQSRYPSNGLGVVPIPSQIDTQQALRHRKCQSGEGSAAHSKSPREGVRAEVAIAV